jgi:ABC-type phosphate/phosphonate transport system ATPase subunit
VGLREGRVVFDAAPAEVSAAMVEDLYRIERDGIVAEERAAT